MKTRLLVALAAIMLTSMSVVAPVSAAKIVAPSTGTTSEYYWDGTWEGGGWIDVACSSSNWAVRLYQDADFKGRHVKICSRTGDFCYVPWYDLGSSNTCESNSRLWSDQASSIKVLNSSSHCVVLYSDTWFSGDHNRYPYGYSSSANLGNPAGPGVGNDEASSLKLADPASCP